MDVLVMEAPDGWEAGYPKGWAGRRPGAVRMAVEVCEALDSGQPGIVHGDREVEQRGARWQTAGG